MARTTGIQGPSQPTTAGWVYIWDMLDATNPQLILNGQSQPGSREGSDAAFLFGDRALALATNQTWGVTDPLRVWDLSGAPSVALLQSNTGLDSAWDASVGIAGSQLLPTAAVRHAYAGASVWDLKTGLQLGALRVLPDFNSLCTAGGGAGDARGLSDAVAITQQRVITIANLDFPHALAQPVAVPVSGAIGIDVVDSAAPGLPASDLPRGCGQPLDFVHDLAVSPNETLCAISGRRFFAIYELATGARTDSRGGASYPTPNFIFRPAMSIATMDSIEMTNDRVVVIGNDHGWIGGNAPAIPLTPAADTTQCRVTLARVRSTGTIAEERTWTGAQLFPGLPAGAPTRACDLAISPRGRWAVVHTRAGVAIFDLSAPLLSNLTPFVLPAADPLNFPAGTGAQPGEVVSDTVVCTNTTAVTIGSLAAAGNTSNGFVNVINVAAAGGPTMTTLGLGVDILPTDVALTPDGTKAVVRALNRSALIPDQNAGAGLLFVLDLVTTTLTTITSPSGDTFGRCRGADHVECADAWAITGGDDSGNSGRVQLLAF